MCVIKNVNFPVGVCRWLSACSKGLTTTALDFDRAVASEFLCMHLCFSVPGVSCKYVVIRYTKRKSHDDIDVRV